MKCAMALAWLDPGDLALVPDPGYPTYRMSAYMVGAEVYDMPLLLENDFFPAWTLSRPKSRNGRA